MMDLKRIRAVALDIAGANRTYERQDDVSEFIWHLLERHYRMFLFSSNPDEDLSGEDFAHPGLVFLREAMPPGRALLQTHPELLAVETLWITDDPQTQRWIAEHGMPFMYLQPGDGTPPGGQFLPRLSELSALLHPTLLLMDDLVRMVDDLRRFRPEGPLLVGIGGPPRSDYQNFAVDLRMRLQQAGHELVELMDAGALMRSSEALLEAGEAAANPWVSEEAQRWLREAVLVPLGEGRAVYVKQRPAVLPEDFDAHFPLYVSAASVLLLIGELLFTAPVADALHLSVLLEVSPDETTRRLYEMPSGEKFDPKFTEQYLSREGHIYQDYLERNRVRERVSIRVDANREGAFRLDEREGRPLV